MVNKSPIHSKFMAISILGQFISYMASVIILFTNNKRIERLFFRVVPGLLQARLITTAGITTNTTTGLFWSVYYKQAKQEN